MEATSLFLMAKKPLFHNEWYKKLETALKQLESTESVMIIAGNQSSDAQVIINYDVLKLPFAKIEGVLENSGASITEINIHFPSVVSGTADPYGASVIASVGENTLENIKGVLGIGVSSTGIIKAKLDPHVKNKQHVILQIMKRASKIKNGKLPVFIQFPQHTSN